MDAKDGNMFRPEADENIGLTKHFERLAHESSYLMSCAEKSQRQLSTKRLKVSNSYAL